MKTPNLFIDAYMSKSACERIFGRGAYPKFINQLKRRITTALQQNNVMIFLVQIYNRDIVVSDWGKENISRIAFEKFVMDGCETEVGEFDGFTIFDSGKIQSSVSKEPPTCRNFIRSLPEEYCDTDDECICCLTRGHENEAWTVFECGHRIHVRCAHIWLNRASSCPQCRHSFPQIEADGKFEHIHRQAIESHITLVGKDDICKVTVNSNFLIVTMNADVKNIVDMIEHELHRKEMISCVTRRYIRKESGTYSVEVAAFLGLNISNTVRWMQGSVNQTAWSQVFNNTDNTWLCGQPWVQFIEKLA